MSTWYSRLMRRADGLKRTERDQYRRLWWLGYQRGLRRAHFGAGYGTQEEHQLLLDDVWSGDRRHQAMARGYRAGLTLEPRDPDIKG